MPPVALGTRNSEKEPIADFTIDEDLEDVKRRAKRARILRILTSIGICAALGAVLLVAWFIIHAAGSQHTIQPMPFNTTTFTIPHSLRDPNMSLIATGNSFLLVSRSDRSSIRITERCRETTTVHIQMDDSHDSHRISVISKDFICALDECFYINRNRLCDARGACSLALTDLARVAIPPSSSIVAFSGCPSITAHHCVLLLRGPTGYRVARVRLDGDNVVLDMGEPLTLPSEQFSEQAVVKAVQRTSKMRDVQLVIYDEGHLYFWTNRQPCPAHMCYEKLASVQSDTLVDLFEVSAEMTRMLIREPQTIGTKIQFFLIAGTEGVYRRNEWYSERKSWAIGFAQMLEEPPCWTRWCELHEEIAKCAEYQQNGCASNI